ncbi:MAG TPA: ParA family protein [Candidatus Coatesbacteria bacterium]|nr:ParA family protein [Candidatus Coatesbacteria bacterium]
MTRRIAIANQKGGVGKTTTAINLGASLAAADRRVLIVDTDPQGNAASGLGVFEKDPGPSVMDALLGRAVLEDTIRPTEFDKLFIAPSVPEMIGLERDLLHAKDAPYRLSKAVNRLTGYDFILFDCPPSLGILTLGAMLAAQSILIPVQAEYYALEGLTQLLHAVEYVRERLGHPLEIEGFLLTMYDQRTRLAADVEAEVRRHFGGRVYRTVIPRNVRLSEAPSRGMPAIEYALASKGAQSYIALASELLAQPAVVR